MPYKIIPEDHGLLIQWWGDVATSEIVQMQEQGHARQDFDRLHYAIHDFSACDHFAIVESDIEYSAALDGAASKTNNKIKIAVVGGNQEVMKVVNAYINYGLSPYPVRVFFSLEDARAWVTQTC